jgi:hypothetical protein
LAGTTASGGKYESSITVSGGSIVIAYGGAANAKITNTASNKLGLVPYTNANNDILWLRGIATMPASASASTAGAAVTTTILPQYPPTSCHS